MSALDSEFLSSFNQFPGEIYQHTVQGVDGNVVFSPFSILIALSYAMFGASGRTSTEMKTALKFNEISEEKLLESFQKLCEKLEESDVVKIANKIYLKENYSIKPKFKEIATKNFNSEVESIDFEKKVEAAATINDWVESKTNNKIKDLIKTDLLKEDTRFVLINAIYFKDSWAHKFNPHKTVPGSFYLNDDQEVEAKFMEITRNFQYAKFDDLDAAAMKLPYKNSNCSMIIILPNSRNGLSNLESKLKGINFGDVIEKMSSRKVILSLPKFKIEFEIELEEPLKKMGMERMFSDDAEFDNLVDSKESIKISKVVHKAFIEVGEKGTEAAVATFGDGVLVSGKIYKKPPIRFIADHPFLFALMQDSKVLFIGRKVE